VTESDILTAVTGYLGRDRGRVTKEAEEARFAKEQEGLHHKEQAAQSSSKAAL